MEGPTTDIQRDDLPTQRLGEILSIHGQGEGLSTQRQGEELPTYNDVTGPQADKFFRETSSELSSSFHRQLYRHPTHIEEQPVTQEMEVTHNIGETRRGATHLQ